MAGRGIRLLGLVVSVCGLWLVASPAGATADRPATALGTLEQGVLSSINALRSERGLAPLRFSSRLSAAARVHTKDMAARGYFSHTSANGSSFDRRIARFYPIGKSRYWSVGENLLWSSPDVSPERALEMWLNSPEHKKNMLSAKWREIGLSALHVTTAPGTFSGREVTIVTTDFGIRK